MTRKSVETNQETKDNEETKKNADQIENENLKQELKELREMMAQLMSQNKKEENTQNSDEENLIEINPKSLVKLISLSTGGLNLKGNNVQPYRFKSYGEPKNLTFEEVSAIYYNHPKTFQQGSIYIKDKNVVKALDLDSYYENILDDKKLDGFFKLPENEISYIYQSASKSQKETMITRIIEEYAKGNRDYMDHNKIKLLSDLTGKDLLQLATNKIKE